MRTRFLIAAFAVVPIVVMAEDKAAEAELKHAIAQGLVDIATFAQSHKLLEEARPFVDEALALDPENAKAKTLKPKLAGEGKATDADKKALAKKLETGGKKLAALFRELSSQAHAAKDDATYDAWLLRAFELD